MRLSAYHGSQYTGPMNTDIQWNQRLANYRLGSDVDVIDPVGIRLE